MHEFSKHPPTPRQHDRTDRARQRRCRAQKEEKERTKGTESLWLLEAPVRKIILQTHTPARTSQCWRVGGGGEFRLRGGVQGGGGCGGNPPPATLSFFRLFLHIERVTMKLTETPWRQ